MKSLRYKEGKKEFNFSLEEVQEYALRVLDREEFAHGEWGDNLDYLMFAGMLAGEEMLWERISPNHKIHPEQTEVVVEDNGSYTVVVHYTFYLNERDNPDYNSMATETLADLFDRCGR